MRRKSFIEPSCIEPSCLYPTEDEIGRVLLGDRWQNWSVIAAQEEKQGLPRISKLYGGRYWPSVKDFYNRRYRLFEEQADSFNRENEGENFNELERKRARARNAKA